MHYKQRMLLISNTKANTEPINMIKKALDKIIRNFKGYKRNNKYNKGFLVIYKKICYIEEEYV
jgi:hypothetical protein